MVTTRSGKKGQVASYQTPLKTPTDWEEEDYLSEADEGNDSGATFDYEGNDGELHYTAVNGLDSTSLKKVVLEPFIQKQLLQDIEDSGGLHHLSKARSLKSICDARKEEFGNPGTPLRRAIQHRVRYLKSWPLPQYHNYLAFLQVTPYTSRPSLTSSGSPKGIYRTPKFLQSEASPLKPSSPALKVRFDDKGPSSQAKKDSPLALDLQLSQLTIMDSPARARQFARPLYQGRAYGTFLTVCFDLSRCGCSPTLRGL